MPETTQVLLRRGLLGVGAALLAIAAPWRFISARGARRRRCGTRPRSPRWLPSSAPLTLPIAIVYVLPDVKTVEQVFGMGETFVAHHEASSSR